MKTITIPAEAVIDLTSRDEKGVIQATGDVIVFLDHIVYMRNTNDAQGLLRMNTGVDIEISKDWFDKVVEEL